MTDLAGMAAAVARAHPATEADRRDLAAASAVLSGNRLLRVSEVARILGVSSATTVRNWLEQGQFPGAVRTTGGHRLFRLEDVLAVKERMDLTRVENAAGRVEFDDFGDVDPYARG